MMRTLRLGAVLVLAGALNFASAQAPANCALANTVDRESYSTLTMDSLSEVDQDNAAYNWAECRRQSLDTALVRSPQLRTRIMALRKQYREMRTIESELAGIRAGGGTMYSHAIPRSFAPLEVELESLAMLARSHTGATTGQLYAKVIKDAKDQHAAYLKTLRAYKPKPDETYVRYEPKTWNAQVSRYEALGKSIMQTLGGRGDAATALGYSILTRWVFDAVNV